MKDDVYEDFQRQKEVIEYLNLKGENFRDSILTLWEMERGKSFSEAFISTLDNYKIETKSE